MLRRRVIELSMEGGKGRVTRREQWGRSREWQKGKVRVEAASSCGWVPMKSLCPAKEEWADSTTSQRSLLCSEMKAVGSLPVDRRREMKFGVRGCF